MITNPGRSTSPTSSARGVMKSTPVATASVSLVNSAKPQRAAPSQVLIAFPISSVRLIAERASSTAQVLHELYGQHYGAYYHWGLGE